MSTAESGSDQKADAGAESIPDTFKGIWQALPGLLSDRIELLSVELRRAGLALLHVVVMGMALSVLGITVWLMLWVLFVAGLAMWGLHWMTSLLIALIAQLLLVAWAVHRVKRLLPLLQLPATRRRLMFPPSPSAPKPAAPSAPVSQPDHTAHDTAPST